MTLKQKNLKLSHSGHFVLNLCIYFFMSTVIYYLLSSNINLAKLSLILALFVLSFLFSARKSEIIIQKLKLKNTLIFTKCTLALITFTAALLIYNSFTLNTAAFYLLVLSTAPVYGVLNRAYYSYYQKSKRQNNHQKIKEIILQHNLEKLLIVILAVSIVNIIEVNTIPVILSITAAYYLLSAYINTFQEI